MDLLDFGGVFPMLLLCAGMAVRSSPSTAATMRILRSREDMPRSRLVGDWVNLKAALEYKGSSFSSFCFLFVSSLFPLLSSLCNSRKLYQEVGVGGGVYVYFETNQRYSPSKKQSAQYL